MSPTCRVCGADSQRIFERQILQRYSVSFYSCTDCRFVQTEAPHWLDEAYASPLAVLDTGLVFRNLGLLPRVATLLTLLGVNRRQCVDVGGGCGLFVRLMRDAGFDFYWQDRFAQNLLARGFAAADPGNELQKPVGCVTAFEVLEHTLEPVIFFREIEELYSPDHILIQTEAFIRDPPAPEWQYYGFDHGQHISFFSDEALRHLGAKFNRSITRAGNCHLFSRQVVSPLVLKFAMSRLAHIAFPFVRKALGSKVQEDSERLTRRLRNGGAIE